MKQGKSKVVVAIIIILVIIIAIVAGAYLYLATDLFKGNQELFFKYLAKNGEIIEELTLDSEQTLIDTVKQDKYTTDSEITFNLESNDTQIANEAIPAGNFSIKTTGKADPKNNMNSSETTLKFLDKDLFTLKYIRDNDLYAVKSDEVVNKYLALDNNNLKEFAKKIGITDTSMVPDKIETVNIKELLSISDETKKEILTKYLPVISEKISKDKYTNQKDVAITVDNKDITATAYSLELTQTEVINILTNILNTLKTDDTTLNIVIEKIKLLNNQNTIAITDLKDTIQNAIDELNSIQTIEGETIKITVYAKDGKLVRTQISGGNDKIIIDTQKNDTSVRMIITLDMQNESQADGVNIKKIELAKQIEDTQNTMIAMTTFETGEDVVRVSMQSKTTAGDKVENNTLINVNITDNTYFTAKINTKIAPSSDLKVEKLTSQNSATINKFTPEYIAKLSRRYSK